MPRDTSTDTLTNDLIMRYVTILSTLAGWGTLTDGSRAVYPNLGFPFPQNPFPAAYIYLAGQSHDYQAYGRGQRRDISTITIRVLGGAMTPGSIVPGTTDIPEIACYKMVTAVVNELQYRPYLQDPITGNGFRYIDPMNKVQVAPIGRIQAFNYSEQGGWIGIEIPTTVAVHLDIGTLA